MKPFILAFAVLTLVLFASTGPRPAAADGSLPDEWPALLNCPDVDADTGVSAADISHVVIKFGTHVVKDSGGMFLPGPDYMLLYDLDGGGNVGVSDIATAVMHFGETCPLIETQVAQATLALYGAFGGPDARDPAQANAAGYIQDSQDVPQMGVHLDNPTYLATWPNCCSLGLPGEDTESQLIHPVGLVYTEASGGGPDQLIGGWYLVPNDEVCTFYGIPGPCQSSDEQPLGFGLTNTDEDNEVPLGPQQGWHPHHGLCIWNYGTTSALAAENVPQGNCEPEGIWFTTYAWMMHLYNVVPNPDGRFMLWNAIVP